MPTESPVPYPVGLSPISQLEQNLGAQLLTRSHNGVEPTAAGELLASDGRRLLGSAAALGDRVRTLASNPVCPTLRLGFLANAAAELTPLLVRAFDRRRPDASIAVAELLDEPWVIGSHGGFRSFWELANHRSAPPPLVIEGGTVPEWYSAVASGRAICASPLSASRYDRRPEITFVPIADAEPSVCALAWPRGETSPELRALVEAAHEVRHSLPAELRSARVST